MLARSIEIKPAYGAYMNLGAVYFQDKKFKDAARAYEKALELNDKDYRTWRFLASCYRQIPDETQKIQGCEKRALELLEALLKVNPEDPALLSQLALSYADIRNSEKAIACLAKALSFKPTDGDVLYVIAQAYELLGKRDEAFKYLEEALKRGRPTLQALKNSSAPIIQSLRQDPRFPELVKRVEDGKIR